MLLTVNFKIAHLKIGNLVGKIENRHLAALASEQFEEEVAPASRPFNRNLDENYGHLAARPLENGTRPLCWSVPG